MLTINDISIRYIFNKGMTFISGKTSDEWYLFDKLNLTKNDIYLRNNFYLWIEIYPGSDIFPRNYIFLMIFNNFLFDGRKQKLNHELLEPF